MHPREVDRGELLHAPSLVDLVVVVRGRLEDHLLARADLDRRRDVGVPAVVAQLGLAGQRDAHLAAQARNVEVALGVHGAQPLTSPPARR
jgi:hypothetical protein